MLLAVRGILPRTTRAYLRGRNHEFVLRDYESCPATCPPLDGFAAANRTERAECPHSPFHATLTELGGDFLQS